MRNRRNKSVARFFFVIGLLVVLAAGIPLRAQNEVRYSVAVSKDVMVAMRDGVRLAADIYRPTQNGQLVDGKFPVLLMRTPYNKDDSAPTANSFVPHGYVVVLQDVRGRYKSEGHWRPHYDDPNASSRSYSTGSKGRFPAQWRPAPRSWTRSSFRHRMYSPLRPCLSICKASSGKPRAPIRTVDRWRSIANLRATMSSPRTRCFAAALLSLFCSWMRCTSYTTGRRTTCCGASQRRTLPRS